MSDCLVVAEIGVNHGGDIDRAIELIDVADTAGCDFVKFQVRTPELAVPKDQWDVPKETPWGTVEPYIEYRRKAELSDQDFWKINEYCDLVGIEWFASAWDIPSVERLNQFSPRLVKVPSAKLTDHVLISYIAKTDMDVIVSTGMSTKEEVDAAMPFIKQCRNPLLMACHAQYPVEDESELNLRQIPALVREYGLPVGFSSHSKSPMPAIYSYLMGAMMIECHITLNRAWRWGDNPASLELEGISLVVREVRRIDKIVGDGIKRFYESELPARKKLRGY
jgi:N-acetylneuraminate synthase